MSTKAYEDYNARQAGAQPEADPGPGLMVVNGEVPPLSDPITTTIRRGLDERQRAELLHTFEEALRVQEDGKPGAT